MRPPEARGVWPEEGACLQAMRREGIRGQRRLLRALMPYLIAEIEVKTETGVLARRIGVNAALARLPSRLSQAIPLIRPKIASMQPTSLGPGALVTWRADRDAAEGLLGRLAGWLRETMEREVEPGEKLDKAAREAVERVG